MILPGIAIEYTALQNIAMGEYNTPIELLRLQRQDGTLLYKATTHRGQVNTSGGYPFREITGGMGKALSDLIQAFELDMQMCSRLSGVDMITAGIKTPTANTPNGAAFFAHSVRQAS